MSKAKMSKWVFVCFEEEITNFFKYLIKTLNFGNINKI